MSRQLRNSDVSAYGRTSSSHAVKGLKSSARLGNKSGPGKLRLTTKKRAPSPLIDDSEEDKISDGQESEADETDTNDEDDIALSARPNHKRGHQTGLSMSLSNTTIGQGNRKRTWSNRVAEEDEVTRPVKVKRDDSSELSELDDDEDEDFAIDEDSDTGYENVDLISESEDEDEDHELDEEESIIREENRQENKRRAASSSSSESFNGFGDDKDSTVNNDDDSQEDDVLHTHFDEELERTSSREGPVKSARRVRFADQVDDIVEMSSQSDSDESDGADFFPDIMTPQASLHPSFRYEIEQDAESDESTVMVYNDPDGFYEGPRDDDYSSSYDSDDDETTDEEVEMPPPVCRASAALSSANAKSPARTPQKQVRRAFTTPGSSAKRSGPVLATWAVDPETTSVWYAKNNKDLVRRHPRTPSRPQTADGSVANSVDGSPSRILPHDPFQPPLDENLDLIYHSPAQMMMSGIVNNGLNHPLYAGHVVAPAEAFAFSEIPTLNANDLNADELDDLYDVVDDDYDDGMDAHERGIVLKMDDFFNFSGSSDGEDEDDDEHEAGTAAQGIDPSHAAAFRRNQLRVQASQRTPRGLKDGSVIKTGHVANQAISPARKQKQRNSFSGMGTPSKLSTVVNN